MNRFLVFILLLLLSSCAADAPRQGYLSRDKLIKRHFNKYQIADLEKLMAFFEQQICGVYPEDAASAVDCYKAYCKKLSEESSFGNMNFNIPIHEQEKITAAIRPVSFDALWEAGKSEDKRTLSESFGLKYGGQFNYFLNALAEENPVIQQYVDAFNQKGDITPFMIALVLSDYEQFDLEHQRGRLVIAVHYLTLNRMFDRKE